MGAVTAECCVGSVTAHPHAFRVASGDVRGDCRRHLVGMVAWAIEELTDGQRAVYLPPYVTHPVFWGWIWGTLGTLLLWATLAQMRAGL